MFARARSTTRTPCRTDKPRFLGPERMAAPRSPSRALSVRACRSLSGALHTMARRARVGLPCDLPVPFINAEHGYQGDLFHACIWAHAFARSSPSRRRGRSGALGRAHPRPPRRGARGARCGQGHPARVQKKLRVFSSSPNNLSIAPPTHGGGTTANLKAPPGEPSSGLPRRVAHRPGGESVRSR